MIIVVMGVSGSGKTTVGQLLAARLGFEFADADNFHPAQNVEKMTAGVPLTDRDREPWLRALRMTIESWLAAGGNVVLACSALKQAYRDILVVDSENVRLVYLKGDFALFDERLIGRRGHYMPRQLLESQFETLEEPEESIVVDAGGTPEEIVEAVIKQTALGKPGLS